jgi:hypothetical protein
LPDVGSYIDGSFGTSAGFVRTDMGGAADVVRSVAIQPNGKIVAMGDNGTDFAVARYDSAGNLDPTFGGGDGKVTVDSDVAGSIDTAGGGGLAPDGDIVLAGRSDPDGGGALDADRMVIRLEGGDPPGSPGSPPTPPGTVSPPGATGQQAAALAKCKKKHSKRARKKCRKKARTLPV